MLQIMWLAVSLVIHKSQEGQSFVSVGLLVWAYGYLQGAVRTSADLVRIKLAEESVEKNCSVMFGQYYANVHLAQSTASMAAYSSFSFSL